MSTISTTKLGQIGHGVQCFHSYFVGQSLMVAIYPCLFAWIFDTNFLLCYVGLEIKQYTGVNTLTNFERSHFCHTCRMIWHIILLAEPDIVLNARNDTWPVLDSQLSSSSGFMYSLIRSLDNRWPMMSWIGLFFFLFSELKVKIFKTLLTRPCSIPDSPTH